MVRNLIKGQWLLNKIELTAFCLRSRSRCFNLGVFNVFKYRGWVPSLFCSFQFCQWVMDFGYGLDAGWEMNTSHQQVANFRQWLIMALFSTWSATFAANQQLCLGSNNKNHVLLPN